MIKSNRYVLYFYCITFILHPFKFLYVYYTIFPVVEKISKEKTPVFWIEMLKWKTRINNIKNYYYDNYMQKINIKIEYVCNSQIFH